jgi:hypothetical protein
MIWKLQNFPAKMSMYYAERNHFPLVRTKIKNKCGCWIGKRYRYKAPETKLILSTCPSYYDTFWRIKYEAMRMDNEQIRRQSQRCSVEGTASAGETAWEYEQENKLWHIRASERSRQCRVLLAIQSTRRQQPTIVGSFIFTVYDIFWSFIRPSL